VLSNQQFKKIVYRSKLVEFSKKKLLKKQPVMGSHNGSIYTRFTTFLVWIKPQLKSIVYRSKWLNSAKQKLKASTTSTSKTYKIK